MASTISRIGQHRRRPRWLAQGLDDLLARRPGQAATWLSWLRNAPQSPAERNILRLIGRLAYPARSNIQRGSGCQPAQHEHLCSRSRRQDRGGRAGEDYPFENRRYLQKRLEGPLKLGMDRHPAIEWKSKPLNSHEQRRPRLPSSP